MRYRESVEPEPDRSSQSVAAADSQDSLAPAEALVRAVKRIENVRVLTSRAVRDIGADAERIRGTAEEPNGPIVVRLLESLRERAQRLDDQARGLADALERAVGKLEVRASPPAKPSRRRASSKPPATPVTRASEAESFSEPASEGVRLLALQMAVAGSDRGEVEARLRTEFEVDDTAAVLDEIFGSVPS